jgi:two-component system, OmpR family, copper resistance phosphate regulon response regulator CusR
MRLLIVEDDTAVSNSLVESLTDFGYATDAVDHGHEALALIRDGVYDAVILDVMLPGMDGFDILKTIRREGIDTPILLLTAKDSLPDRLEGFEAGADDYLVKPFAFQELAARLKAITRRAMPPDDEKLVVADLVMDVPAHEVARAGRRLELTPREFSLLECLMQNPGQALSRTMILDRVWDYAPDSFANVVDATILRLRKSVDEGFDKRLIHTIRGVGYKIKA